MKRRLSDVPELMDQRAVPTEELNQALAELDIINRWLGGYRTSRYGVGEILRARKVNGPVSVLDVAAGGTELHRLPLACAGIALLTRIFSRSAIVRHGAPISVRRAFRAREPDALLPLGEGLPIGPLVSLRPRLRQVPARFFRTRTASGRRWTTRR